MRIYPWKILIISRCTRTAEGLLIDIKRLWNIHVLIFHLSSNSISNTSCELCRDIKNALLLPIPSSGKTVVV